MFLFFYLNNTLTYFYTHILNIKADVIYCNYFDDI